MRNMLRGWLGAAVVAVVIFGLAGGAVAQDDHKAVEMKVYDILRDVHDKGRDLYNVGDHAGCYRMFQGLLLSVKPLVEHQAEWVKVIDDGLKEADVKPSMDQRA